MSTHQEDNHCKKHWNRIVIMFPKVQTYCEDFPQRVKQYTHIIGLQMTSIRHVNKTYFNHFQYFNKNTMNKQNNDVTTS